MLPAFPLRPCKFLLSMVLCVGWHTCEVVRGATVTRDAINQGRFRSDGAHNQGAYNTFTGYAAPTSATSRYNSFFVFDLASLTGTIDSASLLLRLEQYTNLDINQPVNAPLTFDVFDVSTAATSLDGQYNPASAAGQVIYNDLGSGNIYATRSVIASQVGSVLNIPLNLLALSDIQAGLTQTFAVGLRLQGPDTATHAVRFGETLLDENTNTPFAQLQLELTALPPDPDPVPNEDTLPLPEPSSLVLCLSLLMIRLKRFNRRKHLPNAVLLAA